MPTTALLQAIFSGGLRIAAGALLPMPLVYDAIWTIGERVTIKGTPPPPAKPEFTSYVPIALGRLIPAVTYTLSSSSRRPSGYLSRRNHVQIPALLRFSALFAELTDELVPMTMANKMTMFHGTTMTITTTFAGEFVKNVSYET